MWSLFPKIYDDYKTLIYGSARIHPSPPERSDKNQSTIKKAKLYCDTNNVQECCTIMKQVRQELLKKNIDIADYMTIENCPKK